MKYRHELKFVVSDLMLQQLKSRLLPIMKPDAHQSDGCYTITSLYYDDIYNRCMEENINGTDRRCKYRVRIYNHSDETIKLEKKIKYRGMTRKESVSLTPEECSLFMQGSIPFPNGNMEELRQKLYSEMLISGMSPKVIVEYDRTALTYPVGNVRITFDENIRSSRDASSLFDKNAFRNSAIMPAGYHIFEVKYDELLPEYISDVISIGMLKKTTNSKYYLARKGEII